MRTARIISRGTPIIAAAVLVAASCGSPNRVVRGVASVDGVPVEEGTIHLRPADQPGARGVGGNIRQGAFELMADALPPGKYLAAVVAFKKTGRTINDAMRGQVEETVQLKLINPVQEIEITAENATDLKIAVSVGKTRGGSS